MKPQTALILIALVAFLVTGACEITQTTSPSSVDVDVSMPAVTTGTTPEPSPPGVSGSITLEPSSISVSVGKNVFVKVIVKDGNGVEVPSENISVNIIDPSLLRLGEIDGRIIAFEGVAAGTTSVIITASGLQTSLVATVTT